MVAVAVAVPLLHSGRDRGDVRRAGVVEPDGVALTGIARLIDEGVIRVRIAGTFALSDAAAAHRELEKGSTFGKIVLTAR